MPAAARAPPLAARPAARHQPHHPLCMVGPGKRPTVRRRQHGRGSSDGMDLAARHGRRRTNKYTRPAPSPPLAMRNGIGHCKGRRRWSRATEEGTRHNRPPPSSPQSCARHQGRRRRRLPRCRSTAAWNIGGRSASYGAFKQVPSVQHVLFHLAVSLCIRLRMVKGRTSMATDRAHASPVLSPICTTLPAGSTMAPLGLRIRPRMTDECAMTSKAP